ncbi:LysR family transcriptional regulator [Treponema sp. JC4]|uniref:LysR family transcriptional regulator n=1 Tax=Treponema sp. JC4 TaxID=1124982 RepID=UPI003510A9FD
MEAFVMIANNGRLFQDRVRKSYLTQPTVSVPIINSLESELGVKLLMRTTKEVNLTRAGKL